MLKTCGTGRQPGNVRQGLAPYAAVGRKHIGKEALGCTLDPRGGLLRCSSRHNRTPCHSNTGYTRPDSVLATAEDGLLVLRRGTSVPQPLSIAANAALGNVAIGCSRLFPRHHLRRIRQPIAHGRENPAVVPPKTLSAANRLQQEQGKNKALENRTPARAETYLTPTIVATIRGNSEAIGGVVHYTAPRG